MSKDNNTGKDNTGDGNSGNRNSGYWNSGNWNSGNWNSGAFNRDCPKMRLFEKELDMTVEEFYEKYDISMDIPLNRWVDKEDMTAEEKKQNNGWETTGGYLKTLDFKEACQVWWSENSDNHERFLTLPGFDAEIFKDITGIDTETPTDKTVKVKLKGGEVISGELINDIEVAKLKRLRGGQK
jgi:hypothetical protein